MEDPAINVFEERCMQRFCLSMSTINDKKKLLKTLIYLHKWNTLRMNSRDFSSHYNVPFQERHGNVCKLMGLGKRSNIIGCLRRYSWLRGRMS